MRNSNPRHFILLCAVAMLAAASCDEPAGKHALESAWRKEEAMPEVILGSSVKMNEMDKTAEVEVTISGIDPVMGYLQAGLMSSTDFDFHRSKFSAIQAANGTVKASVPVEPGSTNWIMATVSTQDGAVFSRKLAVEVPDVAWYYKIAGTYVGTYTSGPTGRVYSNHKIYITLSRDLQNAVVYNFDPFVASVTTGYNPQDRTSNYVVGELDKENRSIKFTPTGKFFSMNSSRYMFAPVSEFDGNIIRTGDSFEMRFSEDAREVTLPWYGLYNYNVKSFEELYKGETVLKAN